MMIPKLMLLLLLLQLLLGQLVELLLMILLPKLRWLARLEGLLTTLAVARLAGAAVDYRWLTRIS